jgi:hypothetical protein
VAGGMLAWRASGGASQMGKVRSNRWKTLTWDLIAFGKGDRGSSVKLTETIHLFFCHVGPDSGFQLPETELRRLIRRISAPHRERAPILVVM